MSITIVHMIGQLSHGGSERQLVLVTKALKERGWNQVVVTLHPGDAWETTLQQNGIPLRQLPSQGGRPVRLIKLWGMIRSFGPSIIHSWSWHTNIYAAWIRPGTVKKRVLSIRGNPMVDRRTGDTLNAVPHRYAYRMADHVVSNSDACVNELRKAGVALPEVSIVSNIIPAGPRACLSADGTIPKIVAVGNLDRLKGYDVLLAALKSLRDEGIEFRVEIAGEGPDRARLAQLREELNLRDRVVFLGTVDRIPELLASADAAVHASFSEGLSNAVLEAMAAGLPVVATSVGDIPRFISDGENGLLVPPRSHQELSRAIRRVLEDRAFRCRLGAAAQATVHERCSVDTVAQQYEAVYRKILNSGRQCPPASAG